jgi:hypothetical protein
MPMIDLTDDKLAAVTAAIRRAIETDRCPRGVNVGAAATRAGQAAALLGNLLSLLAGNWMLAATAPVNKAGTDRRAAPRVWARRRPE